MFQKITLLLLRQKTRKKTGCDLNFVYMCPFFKNCRHNLKVSEKSYTVQVTAYGDCLSDGKGEFVTVLMTFVECFTIFFAKSHTEFKPF